MSDGKILFDSNFNLDLGVSSQSRSYGFSYENFENNVLKTQLFYELEVTIIDTSDAGNYFFEIDRKTIYINNKTDFSQIEKVADIAAQSIFPLKIKIKKDGQIDYILNREQIKDRYLSARKRILEYYKGDKIDVIIRRIDSLFLNDNLLDKFISKNWFFHLYFKPLYADYTDKLAKKYVWKSPVFGNQIIEYDVVQTLQEKYSDDDKVIINICGISIDERTVDEIIEKFTYSKLKYSEAELTPVESKMNVGYKLYKEDRSIFSITGTFETKINETKQQKVQLEIYHLSNSSSYRPLDDSIQKQNFKIFQSWQTAGDEDIIDISKRKWQVPNPNPEPPKILGTPKEKIEFFVDVGSEIKINSSFWDWIISIFKKRK